MAEHSVDEQQIRTALADVQDPESGRSLIQMDQIHAMKLSDGRLDVTLGLTTFAAPVWQETQARVVEVLQAQFPALREVTVRVEPHERPAEPLGEIGLRAKAVVAVGSGKGGVGKSTIAASLAFGLKRSGCTVGLMDADVYGPSVPHLVGKIERPGIVEKRIQPIVVDGVKIMSMGFLVPPGEAVVWRGPMLHGAIMQFLRDTDWGVLDYLIIDMPPGTGDIALTLSQLLPLTGAVIVCTPQDVALLDATKAVAMFRKVNIPVLGMVENMSYFVCPDNGKRYDIFGSGGAKRRAAELEMPFLGEVPINIQMRVNGDEGRVAASFDDPQAAPYLEAICRNLVQNIVRSRMAEPAMPSLPIL